MIRDSISLPEEYPYYVVLTHDVDRMSSRELPVWPKFGGHIYRLLKSRAGDAGIPVNFQERVKDAGDVIKSRLGLGDDPVLQAFNRMIELERSYGVRSTLFLIVKPFTNGLDNIFYSRFHNSRAGLYEIAEYTEVFNKLKEEGWELGVHGIDAWASIEDAKQELEIFRKYFPQEDVGIRMHYLYQKPDTSLVLEKAGFAYDSTVGPNYTANISGDRITPYIPPGCIQLLEFPLIIHDQTVFQPGYGTATYDTSKKMVDEFLNYFRTIGGVMTILWHPNGFGPPQNWHGLYEYILKESLKDGAWLGTAGELTKKMTIK